MKAATLMAFVIFIGVLLFFTRTGKRLRIRASGTANEMIRKDAATVDGAKAYYNVAIEKQEEAWEQANETYRQIIGKIDGYEIQLRDFQKSSMKTNININACIDNGDDDGAKKYLEQQQDIEEKIAIIKEAIKNLRESEKLQREAIDDLQDSIDKLKSEKENAILTIETAQTNEALKVSSGISSDETDKMLEKVRDGIKKKAEQAAGNKIAFENSATIQQKRLDKKMKDAEIESKLNELKAKRG